jgi:YVTN family beta-propeller protein
VVTSPEGTVLRLDQALNRMSAAGGRIGGRPSALLIAFGSIWVASADSGIVSRYGPNAARVTSRIAVGDSPSWLRSSGDAVWVVNRDDDTLVRIDPATNRVSGRPIKVGEEPSGVGSGSGSIWVTNSGDDTVSRLNPCSRRVVETIKVGDHPTGLTISSGSVWVAKLGGRQRPAHRHVTEPRRTDDPGRRRPELSQPRRDDLGAEHRRRHGHQAGSGNRARDGRRVKIGQTADRVSVGVGAVWVTSYADQTLTRLEPAR